MEIDIARIIDVALQFSSVLIKRAVQRPNSISLNAWSPELTWNLIRFPKFVESFWLTLFGSTCY